MGNVMRIFLRDLKRIATTPATWAVLLFLLVLPSLYAWLNIYAFWDPYGQTGNLTVCVVNQDKGTDNETLGTLDLGDQVVDALKENDLLHWVFVDFDQAVDQVNSGAAYAAFVIPEDFSAKVATIVSGDFQQPTLRYYVNEKLGPISPKITDTGATQLDTTINDNFFSTVSERIATEVNDRMAQAKVQAANAKGSAMEKLDAALGATNEARQALGELRDTGESVAAKADAAKVSLQQSKGHLDELSERISAAAQESGQANGALTEAANEVTMALDELSPEVSKASRQAAAALGQTAHELQRAEGTVAALQEAQRVLEEWLGPLGRPTAPETAINRLNLDELRRLLGEAATRARDQAAAIESGMGQTMTAAWSYRQLLADETVPALSASLGNTSGAAARLAEVVGGQKQLIDRISLGLDQAKQAVNLNTEALDQADGLLADLQNDMGNVKTDIAAVHTANSLEELLGGHGLDAKAIADFMSSPTQVKTEKLYPVDSFGSAMAPLFINLTLWIGVFMLMVIMRLEVDGEGLRHLTLAQRYGGRFLLLAVLATLQAVICCGGCVALGVQVHNLPAFFITAIAAALAYLAIQYSLSVTLQYVGKALCIILVFVQIPGATGLYPIEVMPDFFQVIYPLFPFTYSINALREVIGGFYDGFWWADLGMLGLFFVIFVLFGLLVRPAITNLNRLFTREIDESGIINGEVVRLPARRYRMSQMIRLLTDQDEYRAQVNARITRFMGRYPRLKRSAMAVGLAVLAGATALATALQAEKVIILTLWLVWFIAMVSFYVATEYFRDYLGHLVSLESMDAKQMQALMNDRNGFTTVKPLHESLASQRKEKDGMTGGDDAQAASRDNAGTGDANKDGGRP